ncbi:MAG: sugar-binding domain-containing protein [Christensenellales bacterium]
MNAGENKPTGLVKDMDTSILNTLSLIAPDLMEEIELRALILERVAALEPIGRRALAARLHLAEREVRAAAEALKKAGCLTQSASGMELTPQGQSLVEAARAVSGGRRTLSGIELTLSQMLGVERVCVVRGDADIDSGVMEEVARAAARQIRFLLQGAHVMAVTGGRTVAKTAEAIAVAAPMEITVVPAQGGMGGGVSTQANTVAERLPKAGRLLSLSAPAGRAVRAAADELARLPQVRELLELVRHADVLPTASGGRWIWRSGAA